MGLLEEISKGLDNQIDQKVEETIKAKTLDIVTEIHEKIEEFGYTGKLIDSVDYDDDDREFIVLYTNGEQDTRPVSLPKDGYTPIKGKDYRDGIDGKDGKDGLNGKDGKDGKDGENGKDGKDGSSDTAQEIVKKLEALQDQDRLSAKAIKGLEEFMNSGGTIAGASRLDMLADVKIQEPKNGQILVYDKERGQFVNQDNNASGGIQSIVAGTNITVDNTDPLNPIVSSTGGGGGSVTPSSTDTFTNKTIDDYTNFIHADGIHLRVKATEPLVKGDVIMFVGFNAGEQAIEVAKRNDLEVPAIGVIYTATMDTGDFGMAVSNGLFKGLDTSAFGGGTVLYPNASGGFTATNPGGYAQQMAYVVRSHAVNGEIMINVGPVYGLDKRGLTGNAGTNPATNFIGTTDAQPLVVKTNNTERVRVLSGGNVGIGTTTPDSPLHVSKTFSASPTAIQYGANISVTGAGTNSTYGQMGIRSAISSGYTGGAATVSFYGINTSAGTGANLITGNSGVFVNVDSTTIGYNAGFVTYAVNRGSGPAIGTIGLVYGGLGTGSKIGILGTASNEAGGSGARIGVLALGGGAYNSTLPSGLISAALLANNQAQAVPIFVAQDNGTEVFRIADGGNVGIGTSTPLKRLHVIGDSSVLTSVNTYNGAIIESNDNVGLLLATGTARECAISFGDNGNNNMGKIVYSNTTDSMAITVNNAERMRINNAGNVGIGTTSPATKLTVTGGDAEVTDIGSGVILKSPNGTRFRITVGDDGALTTTAL